MTSRRLAVGIAVLGGAAALLAGCPKRAGRMAPPPPPKEEQKKLDVPADKSALIRDLGQRQASTARKLTKLFSSPTIGQGWSAKPRFHEQGMTVCRKACAYVRVICKAAVRICAIAEQLDDELASQSCDMANQRCQTATKQVQARCKCSK